MPWRTEKEWKAGQDAWRQGRLDVAVQKLEAVLADRPGLVEAFYPLARAYHEKGDSERALELLAEAREVTRSPAAGAFHCALIHFDLQDDRSLTDEIGRLGADNQIVPALESLRHARATLPEDAGPVELTYPALTLWNSELAGRLLALLEERFARQTEPDKDDFHHGLFAPPSSSGDGTSGAHGATPTAAVFAKRGTWAAAVNAAFAARRFDDVRRLWTAKEVPESWRRALTPALKIYSDYATLPGAKAARLACDALAEYGPGLDLHFLHGLCVVRAGDIIAAGHAFVRSARLDDDAIHDVIRGQAKQLELTLAIATS